MAKAPIQSSPRPFPLLSPASSYPFHRPPLAFATLTHLTFTPLHPGDTSQPHTPHYPSQPFAPEAYHLRWGSLHNLGRTISPAPPLVSPNPPLVPSRSRRVTYSIYNRATQHTSPRAFHNFTTPLIPLPESSIPWRLVSMAKRPRGRSTPTSQNLKARPGSGELTVPRS